MGDFERAQELIVDIGKGKNWETRFPRVRKASETLGKGSDRWAMHVKGWRFSLQLSCCPGMALSFGTLHRWQPQGCLGYSWEISTDRLSYSKEKVQKLIEFQRIRGGFFRVRDGLPASVGRGEFWASLVSGILEAVTGSKELGNFYKIGTASITSSGLLEKRDPSVRRAWDYPPDRWLRSPFLKERWKGEMDRQKFDQCSLVYTN